MQSVLQGMFKGDCAASGAAASDAAHGHSAFRAAAEPMCSSSGLLELCSSWAEGL